MKTQKMVASLVLVIATAGCKLAESPPESRAVIDKYFEIVKSGSVKPALDLFSPEFFGSTTAEQYVDLVDRAHAKLGALKSYSATTSAVNSFSGTTGSGIYTTFQCEVVFEKYHAVESFRVF